MDTELAFDLLSDLMDDANVSRHCVPRDSGGGLGAARGECTVVSTFCLFLPPRGVIIPGRLKFSVSLAA